MGLLISMDGFLKKGEVERIEKEPYLPKYFKFYSKLQSGVREELIRGKMDIKEKLLELTNSETIRYSYMAVEKLIIVMMKDYWNHKINRF